LSTSLLFKGDRKRMQRIVTNLLENAIKYTPDNGAVEVNAMFENGTIKVDFKDTGIGIAPQDLHKIFDSFFTTKESVKGVGLGLSVCYGFVKDHGGDIKVESTVGEGTTFTIILPVSEQDLDSMEAQLDALRASADEAAARVEQRQAAVEERRSSLAKTVVRAPVAGRLGERRAEVGMLVDPSTMLFVVGDLDELIVEVNLTESMLDRVEEGLPVQIETRDAVAEPVRAELSRISPFLAEESFTTRGEIDVDNREGRLRPGMFVTVRILVGQSQRATLVPVSAVWEDPVSGAVGAFVVQEATGLEEPTSLTTLSPDQARRTEFRQVDVRAVGRGVAGVDGIDAGAWVVTVGQHLLATELQFAGETEDGSAPVDAEVQRGAPARVRPVPWERVLELQDLQDEDLLESFLDKQRKISAALGAEIPDSEDVVNRVLDEATDSAGKPEGN